MVVGSLRLSTQTGQRSDIKRLGSVRKTRRISIRGAPPWRLRRRQRGSGAKGADLLGFLEMPLECQRCTLLNLDNAVLCEVCEAPLPRAARAATLAAASAAAEEGTSETGKRSRTVLDLTNSDDEEEQQRAAPSARTAAAAAAVNSDKDCIICMEPLGTNEGIQALGCMDTYCKQCIATHIHRQHQLGMPATCPICKYAIPHAEQIECGPSTKEWIEDSDDDDESGEEDSDGDEDDDSDEDDGAEGEEGEEGEEDEDDEDDSVVLYHHASQSFPFFHRQLD